MGCSGFRVRSFFLSYKRQRLGIARSKAWHHFEPPAASRRVLAKRPYGLQCCLSPKPQTRSSQVASGVLLRFESERMHKFFAPPASRASLLRI